MSGRGTRAERDQTRALWFASLAGPAAWSLQMVVDYNLEEIACSAGSQTTGEIWGIGVEIIALVWNVLLMGVTVAALLVGLACVRKTRKVDDSPGERATWMAVASVMSAGLFLISIVYGFAPMLFLEVCAG